MLVSAIAGVRPYLSTPEGLTGDRGRTEGTGFGIEGGSGCGAGAPGAEGGFATLEVGVGAATGVFDCDAKIRAVREAPVAAEPAAMRAKVDFDMLSNVVGCRIRCC